IEPPSITLTGEVSSVENVAYLPPVTVSSSNSNTSLDPTRLVQRTNYTRTDGSTFESFDNIQLPITIRQPGSYAVYSQFDYMDGSTVVASSEEVMTNFIVEDVTMSFIPPVITINNNNNDVTKTTPSISM